LEPAQGLSRAQSELFPLANSRKFFYGVPMNMEKFTLKAQEAVQAVQTLAQQRDHGQIENAHLLLALLEQKDGVVPAVIEKIGADVASLRACSKSQQKGESASCRAFPCQQLKDSCPQIAPDGGGFSRIIPRSIRVNPRNPRPFFSWLVSRPHCFCTFSRFFRV
jgi:hypothetical protein